MKHILGSLYLTRITAKLQAVGLVSTMRVELFLFQKGEKVQAQKASLEKQVS